MRFSALLSGFSGQVFKASDSKCFMGINIIKKRIRSISTKQLKSIPINGIFMQYKNVEISAAAVVITTVKLHVHDARQQI